MEQTGLILHISGVKDILGIENIHASAVMERRQKLLALDVLDN